MLTKTLTRTNGTFYLQQKENKWKRKKKQLLILTWGSQSMVNSNLMKHPLVFMMWLLDNWNP